MNKPYDQRAYSVHPSSLMMVLILAGLGGLFAALSAAYLYTRVDKGMQSIQVPGLFIVNTFILAISSYSIHRCVRFFGLRDEQRCYRWGVAALIATVLFLCLQGVAWYLLLSRNQHPGSSGGYGYLYAISILHFLHVTAGLPFLSRILIPLLIAIRQGNAALIFIDDGQRRRLRHTAWYWHFIDVVWIYLVLFFLLNRLF